jgi:hypothetical protein
VCFAKAPEKIHLVPEYPVLCAVETDLIIIKAINNVFNAMERVSRAMGFPVHVVVEKVSFNGRLKNIYEQIER